MTMITDQQRQIVAHFASFMPAVERAAFEARVLKALPRRRGGNLGQQTTRACLETMKSLGGGVFKDKAG